jgi:cation:H+ antiporter
VIPLLILVVKYKKKHPSPDLTDDSEALPELPISQAALWFAVGLAVLLGSAEITVWGAKSIAAHAGISELIIGLTVVAIGTSLPELAASVISALRGHHDIALGNIFGSNLFNLMLVMTSAGAIAPIALGAEVFYRDFLAMAAMTLLMVVLAAIALRSRAGRISKAMGLLLLVGYGYYYMLLWPAITLA